MEKAFSLRPVNDLIEFVLGFCDPESLHGLKLLYIFPGYENLVNILGISETQGVVLTSMNTWINI